MQSKTGLELAVIGVSGKFPQASNIEEFWEKIASDQELLTKLDKEELSEIGIGEEYVESNNFIASIGKLDKPEFFDAAFFGLSHAEAEVMDPQIRVMLECAYEALQDAGYDPFSYPGYIGVYTGASAHEMWEAKTVFSGKEAQLGQFETEFLKNKDFISSHISYRLNLKGPSISTFTACSTSLNNVHLACQSVLNGECDIALAGGVSINLVDSFGYEYQDGMILAKDGKCKPFDKDSSGTISSDGAGIVAIKTLEAAIRDGDQIYATILATCSNNDGNNKIGYTAPSLSGQVELMNAAFQLAEIDPETISYVEAHGTGTNLGDPIEFEALNQSFKTDKKQFCALGSLKSNAGHMDVAAGIGGLIKTVLALKHKTIPGTLHFTEANPHCDFENSPFYINAEAKAWTHTSDLPRRAAVSSLGIGGSNAHVVLEEYIPLEEPKASTSVNSHVLLSAKSENALKDSIEKHVDFFKASEVSKEDALYTLAYGRERMKYRDAQFVPFDTTISDVISTKKEHKYLASLDSPSVVFMYSGQGSQYAGMYYDLYQSEEGFKDYVDYCLSLLPNHRSELLRGLLFTEEEKVEIRNTENSQTALFICMYSLSRFLMDNGVSPSHLIGHSIGEYVCACVSGVFELKDALELVEKRGECMSKAPKGAMLSVNLDASDLRKQLPHGVSIAAVNSDTLCVVSGDTEAIDAFSILLDEKGVFNKKLRTSHAFHSHLMDGVLQEYRTFLDTKLANFGTPTIPYISNVTGKYVSNDEVTSSDYWLEQLRGEVKFNAGVKTLLNNKRSLFLELGPGNTLTQLTRSNVLFNEKESRVINLIPKSALKSSTKDFFNEALGEIWENGYDNIVEFLVKNSGNRVSLPTYPFERKKYWIDSDFSNFNLGQQSEFLPVNQWLNKVNWKKTDLFEHKDSEFSDTTSLIFYPEKTVFESNDQFILHQFPVTREDKDQLVQSLTEYVSSKAARIQVVFDLSFLSHKKGTLEDQENVLNNILFIVDWLGQHSESKCRVTLLIKEQNQVLGTEKTDPYWSSLQGTIRTISQEYAQIEAQVLDVSQNATSTEIAQLLNKNTACFTAYRNGIVWEKNYTPFHVDTESNWEAKPGDTYVITGGFGNVGSLLATYLSEKEVNIVLFGRNVSNQNSTNAQLVANLKAKGANVYEMQVDVNDRQNFETALDEVYDQHGKITGIIHAAAQMRDCIKYIGEVRPDDFRKVASTKMHGADVLLDWCENKSVGLVAMMSSLSTELGGLGYAMYAVSNAYLDAKILAMPTSQSTRFLTINWDGWNVRSEAADGLINPDQGKELLSWVFQQTNRQTLVATSSIDKRIEHWTTNDTEDISSDVEKYSRPELSSNYVPSTTNLEQELITIWENFFRMEPIGIEDDFFELGGDSLKGMKLVNLYKNLLGEMVYVSIIFDALTIKEVAQYMHKHYKKGACKIDGIDYTEDDSYNSIMSKEYFESIRSQIKGLDYKPVEQKNQRSVFVLSSSRSGSTLLRVMLAGNSHLFAPPELELLNYTELVGDVNAFQGLIRAVRAVRSCSAEEAQGIVQKMIDEGWDTAKAYSFLQQHIGDKTLVEKTPSYSFNKHILDQIEVQFEDPFFIHLVRHPYGMINSKKSNKLDLLRGELDDLFSSGTELAEFEWILSNTNIDAFLQTIPSTRQMFLRYEDLVSNPDTALKELSSALEIPFEESMLNPYEDQKSRMTDGLHEGGLMVGDPKFHQHKNISKDNAYKWRNELHEDFLHPDTLDLAKNFGYDSIEGMNTKDWEKCQEENKYPVSSQQRKLLVYHELYPLEINYNIPRAILLGTDLDKDRLTEAVIRLTEAHPILKTCFIKGSGVFYQTIVNEINEQVQWHASVSMEQLNEKLKSIIQPYDLYKAPLFRIAIIPVQDHGNVIFFDTHHTLTDAISQNILISNLLALYEGKKHKSEDLTYHYYAFVQSSSAFNKQLEKQREYWMERYSGQLPLLQLKTDFTRPEQMSFKGAELSLLIDNELNDRFVDATKSLKVSRYNLAFAAYQLFLHKLSSQEDLIVGTPLTNRPDRRFESTIGMFVNTLPLRSQISLGQSFEEMILETKQEIKSSFDNADYSLDDLINALGVKRDLSRNPLFDSMFVYQNFELDGEEIGNKNLSYVDFNEKISRYDLSCVIYDFKDSLKIHFEYSSDLFTEETIQRYLDYFIEIMQFGMQNLNAPLTDFPSYISREESDFMKEGEEDLTINFSF